MEADQSNNSKSRKLSIRLNLGNHGERRLVIEEEERGLNSEVLVDNSEYSHVRNICGEGFMSGKALGDHTRSHGQQENIKHRRLVKEVATFYPRKPMSNQIQWCRACGKEFQSKYSLYGHMRSHPERTWRGINPPSNLKNMSAESTISNDDDGVEVEGGGGGGGDQIDFGSNTSEKEPPGGEVDLKGSLPAWSRTAKRGRSGITGTTTPTSHEPCFDCANLGSQSGGSEELEEAVEEAVGDLLMPSIGDGDHAAALKEGSTDIEVSKICEDGKNTPSVEEEGCAEKDGKSRENPNSREEMEKDCVDNEGKAVLEYNGDRSRDNDNDDDDDDDDDSDSNELMEMVKRKCKKRSSADPEKEADVVVDSNSAATPRKYLCVDCNKSFGSPQGLGGHRTSHSRSKRIHDKMEPDRST